MNTLRLLVCGSRSWQDRGLIYVWLTHLQPRLVIHGAARGADTLAGEVAKALNIPVRVFPADWLKWGRRAGPLRNQQMLDAGLPDKVIAFWDGESRGTLDMIKRAKADVEVIIVRPGEVPKAA